MSQETAVFIGNLRKDCQKRDLVSNLKQLFRQTLGIPVGEGDVEVINKGKNSRYAFVYVQSKNELKRAIDQLETYRKRSQLSFDFSLLVDQNDTLRLGEKYSVSKKRDSSRGVPVVEEQFYTEGMNLGNETRDKEFKEGGGIYKDLRILGDHVDKYMCGFLNSSQQGTLFIGVKDSGKNFYRYIGKLSGKAICNACYAKIVLVHWLNAEIKLTKIFSCVNLSA